MLDICEKCYLGWPRDPSLQFYMELETGIVALPILETVLLMCFRSKAITSFPSFSLRTRVVLIHPQRPKPCYDSGTEYISVEIVQPSPASIMIGSPPFLRSTPPSSHLLSTLCPGIHLQRGC